MQTLPIILDTNKIIRLIFCELYKLTESERKAETDAIRQRRLSIIVYTNVFCTNKFCDLSS